MSITPFFIEFLKNNERTLAEIKPCCEEKNVFYYDVAINNKYQFTITPGTNKQQSEWSVSFKNADNYVDPQLVQAIGEQIDKHYLV